ncbi:MAG: c-type cytochrome [Pseudomonadales bacterium]
MIQRGLYSHGLLLSVLWVAIAATATAETFPGVENAQRARVNYMLNCQGCHGAHGTAAAGADVPAMQNYVGHFLGVEGGRAFIVQVPGSANAALSDAALAELLNWMLPTLSGPQLPIDFRPYSKAEVAELRASPLKNVAQERARLVQLIEAPSR